MVKMLQFLRHPTAQVVTVHLLWQFILLALYKILIWVTPHIFSSGPTAFLMPQILSVVASIAAFRIMLLTSTRCNISFGFTAKSSVTDILVGLLLGALAYMIYVVISLSGGWYRIIGIDNRYYFRFALLYCFLVAIAEETIFRGYIFQTLEKHWDTKIALLGSSFLFGLAHVINWSGGGRWHSGHLLDWVVQPIFAGFIGGILYSAAFLLTRRMWIPIGLHCAWDTGATIFFNDPYGIASFYKAIVDVNAYRITGIAYWTVTLFIMAFAAILLYIAFRRGNWRSKTVSAPVRLEA